MNILFVIQDNPAEEDAVVVEKILGMRLRKSDKDVSDKHLSLISYTQ